MRANHEQFVSADEEGRCCWNGCGACGEYPAPKSPSDTTDRYHFCLEHVRRYNKSWDFFEGMRPEEIEAFHIDSITGHRKTSRRGANQRKFSEEDLREELFREFDFFGSYERKKETISDSDRKYMKILGVTHPISLKEIKIAYKDLAKKYHPDVKGGADEEKFKEVSEAYHYLKKVVG